MSKSTGSRRGKQVSRPKKPYPDFPLYAHPAGYWAKKVRGQFHYFGRWGRVVDGKLTRVEGDGWKEALDQYKVQADDLHAGRTPRVTGDGLTVGMLCNKFLTSKHRKVEAGEIGTRMFEEYKVTTDLLVEAFGVNRLVEDLAADDFGSLRAKMAKRWGPHRMQAGVIRVRSVFKYGTDNGLIEKAIRYGTEFRVPGKSVLRRHRAAVGEKMLEAADVRKLIDAADVQLRAMIYLGVNAAYGNADCASLQFSHLDLNRGWATFPRPKTGIPRRCPLWPETVEAIREAIAERAKPVGYDECGLVFLSGRGTVLVRGTSGGRTDMIAARFERLLDRFDLRRPGFGFYTLRHVFRTVADEARDQVAADLIMGHADNTMAGHYRERIDDARLQAVADHVRNWLFPTETPTGTTP